jgi:hypothetical protein
VLQFGHAALRVTENEPSSAPDYWRLSSYYAFAVIREAMRSKALVALGRIALEHYERGLLGTTLHYPQTTRSLCTSSSSIWKHWNLIFAIDATRATGSTECGDDAFVIEIAAPIWCAETNSLTLPFTPSSARLFDTRIIHSVSE